MLSLVSRLTGKWHEMSGREMSGGDGLNKHPCVSATTAGRRALTLLRIRGLRWGTILECFIGHYSAEFRGIVLVLLSVHPLNRSQPCWKRGETMAYPSIRG